MGRKSQTEDEWKFTLKNAYINREMMHLKIQAVGLRQRLYFKNAWHSVSHSGQANHDWGSVQYAVRLSSDKHVADTVLIKKHNLRHQTI